MKLEQVGGKREGVEHYKGLEEQQDNHGARGPESGANQERGEV